MKPLERTICGRYGEHIQCPPDTFAVGSCGAGMNSDCSQLGCSGRESWSGLQCKEWGFLNDIEWDYSAEPYYEIDIVRDINPLVGTITDMEVNLDSSLTVSVTASATFNAQFDVEGGVQADMLSLFGFPSFSGGLDGDDFVELDLVTSLDGGANFNAAAEAQATFSANAQLLTFRVSSLDTRAENFVRFVEYKRRRIQDVFGNVTCCKCDTPTSEVRVRYESVQGGYLVLYIKNYPGLDLERISGHEFVELYLDGEIGEFASNPRRGFLGDQTLRQRMRIYLRGLLFG